MPGNNANGPKPINYVEIEQLLKDAKDDTALFEAIVNVPFRVNKVEISQLSLGVIVLLLVNAKTKTIDRIALTENEVAERTKRMSVKRFEEIKIPQNHPQNAIAQAINSGTYQVVTDWQYLFVPEMTPEESRFNQADGGIGCSIVYPLVGARGDGGALIFSYFKYASKINGDDHAFMKAYSELVAQSLT